jgi:hypothetical protein
MYQWMVLTHFLGLFLFLMAHGVSAAMSFRVMRERNINKLQALVELSSASYGLMYAGFGLLLLSGIISGFLGHWWGAGWIWVSLGLLILLTFAMSGLGSRYYSRLRKLVGAPYMDKGKIQPPQEPASEAEIDTLIKAGKPILLTALGFGGLAIITWLMIFKPF